MTKVLVDQEASDLFILQMKVMLPVQKIPWMARYAKYLPYLHFNFQSFYNK